MRKGIERIRYSKKSIRVDYAFGRFWEASEQGLRPDSGTPSEAFSDGETVAPTPPDHAARCAAFESVSAAPDSTTPGNLIARSRKIDSSAATKKPNGISPLGFGSAVCNFKNGGNKERFTTLIDMDIPNLIHDYWENYHLTGEFYVRGERGGI